MGDVIKLHKPLIPVSALHGYAKLSQDKLRDAVLSSDLPKPEEKMIDDNTVLRLFWNSDIVTLEITLDQAGKCAIRHWCKRSETEITYGYNPMPGGVDGLINAIRELLKG